MPTATDKKIAFIATGGGTSCAYSAGVIWALEEMGILPDIMIGSSGSAGTLSYALCGRAEYAAKKLWIEETTIKCLFKKGFDHYFDVDFLVDSMRDRFPFIIPPYKLQRELYLAVTNDTNGQLEYLHSKQRKINWYEAIRASMAMPFFYGKKIKIANKLYIDGDISSDIQDHINLAVTQNVSIIISSETNRHIPFDLIPYIGFALFNKDVRTGLINSIKRFLFKKQIKTNIPIIHIHPKKRLPTGTLNNSKKAIYFAVMQGYNDTYKNSELLKMFNKHKNT